MAVAVQRYRARASEGPARLDDLLHHAARELISSPHHGLTTIIESSLAGAGEALDADRALVATRENEGFSDHYSWERKGPHGVTRRSDADGLDPLLGQICETLICPNRRSFPAGVKLPPRVLSGIFVPFDLRGKPAGVLAITAKAPRAWPAETVKAIERLAGLVGAGLDRMASLSSLSREQDKRLQAEAETRRLRDQLAHAGRVSMLGELAASLAHELNQPLTAIYTNAQAATRFLDQKPPVLSEARIALHDLGSDCRRAGDVLGRLRQMFRRHETERVPLAIGPLIEHVLKLLHEDAVTRDVNLVLDIRPNLPLVNGDRVQLEQVVMNLLVNAFEAVTGQPERNVTVRASSLDGRVAVSVYDTGPGISRIDLQRIFEPFFTRKPQGMGIGLAICRTIVEAHGGRVSARNRTERGSVFELSLPALPAASKGGAP